MAHIPRYHINPKDKLALIARKEAAEHLGLSGDEARALYPMALACVIVGAFRQEQMNIAGIEILGFDRFLELVKSEFADSALAEWEVRQAFEIICQYLRNPTGHLHFALDTPASQRLLTAVKKDMGLN